MKKAALMCAGIASLAAVYTSAPAFDMRDAALEAADLISSHGAREECQFGARVSNLYASIGKAKVMYRLTDSEPYGRFGQEDVLQVFFMNDGEALASIEDIAADGVPDSFRGFSDIQRMTESYRIALDALKGKYASAGLIAKK